MRDDSVVQLLSHDSVPPDAAYRNGKDRESDIAEKVACKSMAYMAGCEPQTGQVKVDCTGILS
jgi:hypothetical protein